MLGVKVRRSDAEVVRRELSHLNLLDKGHAIIDEEGFTLMPVVRRPPQNMLGTPGVKFVNRSFPERIRRLDPIDKIRDSASVPIRLKPLISSKWERLGDVAVIRVDKRLHRYEFEVARAYASVLGLKAVLRDTGGISGRYREPVTKLLLGKDTVTTHLENGILYRFDAAKTMFSSGNMEERLRMADIKCDREVVVDMFAGIGYFSLPLAVYQEPKKVIACEINPIAHGYLVENVKLNRVEDRVKPVLGDNRDLKGKEFADRVIMGYVKTTHEFLPAAIRMLRDGGVIHYHETCPNELLPTRPIQRIVDNVRGGRIELLRFKEIKSYAPGVSHVVVDVRVFKPG